MTRSADPTANIVRSLSVTALAFHRSFRARVSTACARRHAAPPIAYSSEIAGLLVDSLLEERARPIGSRRARSISGRD
jgi:hypothetical protein